MSTKQKNDFSVVFFFGIRKCRNNLSFFHFDEYDVEIDAWKTLVVRVGGCAYVQSSLPRGSSLHVRPLRATSPPNPRAARTGRPFKLFQVHAISKTHVNNHFVIIISTSQARVWSSRSPRVTRLRRRILRGGAFEGGHAECHSCVCIHSDFMSLHAPAMSSCPPRPYFAVMPFSAEKRVCR